VICYTLPFFTPLFPELLDITIRSARLLYFRPFPPLLFVFDGGPGCHSCVLQILCVILGGTSFSLVPPFYFLCRNVRHPRLYPFPHHTFVCAMRVLSRPSYSLPVYIDGLPAVARPRFTPMTGVSREFTPSPFISGQLTFTQGCLCRPALPSWPFIPPFFFLLVSSLVQKVTLPPPPQAPPCCFELKTLCS